MPLQEDVLKIGKKLEKMVSSKSVVSILCVCIVSFAFHSKWRNLVFISDFPIGIFHVYNFSQDQASAMELLRQLKKQKMNLEVLQKTKIGMIVNNFRKSTKDDEIISLARSLIKSWKKLIGKTFVCFR